MARAGGHIIIDLNKIETNENEVFLILKSIC